MPSPRVLAGIGIVLLSLGSSQAFAQPFLPPDNPTASDDQPLPAAQAEPVPAPRPLLLSRQPAFVAAPKSSFLAEGRFFETPFFRIGFPAQVQTAFLPVPTSVQRTDVRIYDERLAVPRPGNAIIFPMLSGLALETYVAGQPTASFLSIKNRTDVVAESTRTGPVSPDFVVANIPVRGQDYFGSGWKANVMAVATEIENFSLTETAVGSLRTSFSSNFYNEAEPNVLTQFHLRHLYAQLGHVGIGKTVSAFSDIDARPDTADRRGPNGRMYVLQQMVWGFIPLLDEPGRVRHAEVSLEAPTAEVSIPAVFPAREVVSRIPDVVAALVFDNEVWGHVRLASVYRGIGLETANQSFSQTVFGWGVKVSTHLTPFRPESPLACDAIDASLCYGEGIAHYNYDLQGRNFDAAIAPNGNLRALPLLCYYAGYTHHWTARLRSTVVFSEVFLDGVPSLGDFGYRRGRYASANIAYLAPGDNLQLGLEYQYGSRETRNGAHGDENRIQFVVAIRPKTS